MNSACSRPNLLLSSRGEGAAPQASGMTTPPPAPTSTCTQAALLIDKLDDCLPDWVLWMASHRKPQRTCRQCSLICPSAPEPRACLQIQDGHCDECVGQARMSVLACCNASHIADTIRAEQAGQTGGGICLCWSGVAIAAVWGVTFPRFLARGQLCRCMQASMEELGSQHASLTSRC